jgi:hypothetical protein
MCLLPDLILLAGNSVAGLNGDITGNLSRRLPPISTAFWFDLHELSQRVPRNRRVCAGENDCRERPKMAILGEFISGGRIE